MGLAWITGAAGLIGNYLVRMPPPRWKARPLARADLDLLHFDSVTALFQREKPDAILHCAALSKNPQCDANPPLAFQINRDATAHLSSLAASAKIPFVFLSTDLVFDGAKGNYVESDAVNPLGVYPRTKAEAEKAVLGNALQTVVRLSLNAGHSIEGTRAFNEDMRAAFTAGRTLNLFEDEFRCPLPAEFTARALWEILGETGIFHLCGPEKLSRYEIGELIVSNHPALKPKLLRGSLRDYKGSPRPPDTSMNCAKIQSKLSFALPRFSDWVRAQPLASI
jgi:dTDP-4-dehydrorhamnose reductase